MKTTTLLILCSLLFNVSGFTQNTYNAIVFTENGEKFWVIMNGVRQNETAETNVKILGLNAPSYRFKIIFQDAGIPDLDKNIYLPDHSSEVTYRVKMTKKGEFKLRYFSEVPLPPKPVQASSQVMVSYSTTEVYPANPREEVTTTTTTTTTSGTAPTGGTSENVNISMNIGGLSMGVNLNVNESHGTSGTTTTTSSTTTTTTSSSSTATTSPASTTTHGHHVVTENSGSTHCNSPMHVPDFMSAKNTIASESFDDTKLTVAKQIAGSNCLDADQVKQIAELMSFEDSKLEFAKYAYTRTFDRGNYFKVNNAFKFESTIEELNDYIQTQK
ncbi:MAG: DUF4476 domain-containing protein [Flavobacteriales bacterium]|nr:DUF4476 domain-containing protein [Flavobacteriales bacterium]